MYFFIPLPSIPYTEQEFDVVLVKEFCFFSKEIWLKCLYVNLRKILPMLAKTALLKNVRELASDLKAVVNHVETPVELYEDRSHVGPFKSGQEFDINKWIIRKKKLSV